MRKNISKKHAGFTLVEIMIVVAIIALLASIAVPAFARARQRSQATTCVETCRMIDAAKDQFQIENPGTTVTQVLLAPYVKAGSKLATEMLGAGALDALGQPITVPVAAATVNNPPTVIDATRNTLSANGVLGDTNAKVNAFWGSYANPI